MELELENKKIEFDINNITTILEVIKEYPEDYKILNSDFKIEATKTYELKDFEPIISIEPKYNIANYSWNNHHTPIDNKYLIEALNKCNLSQGLKRDVEDGYIFDNYKNIIIREDLEAIILC